LHAMFPRDVIFDVTLAALREGCVIPANKGNGRGGQAEVIVR